MGAGVGCSSHLLAAGGRYSADARRTWQAGMVLSIFDRRVSHSWNRHYCRLTISARFNGLLANEFVEFTLLAPFADEYQKHSVSQILVL